MKIGLGSLLFLLFAGATEVADWSLAGRQGECAPLTILEKKGPEFRGIESPTQLVEKMRAAGEKAEIKEHKAGSRPAIEVRVPGRNLYVMFVKSDLCGKRDNSSAEKSPERKGR
jgi:hypothetical protein